ncbi:hypothetical protein MKZ38_005194 [Zalerion maritima]|uniref:Alpha-glucosidase n=1 Tax=Zalerion maritima TaxID=339359 RepID=A0AAD5WWQ4_9PEZI|nr:hypothetical protein MKZ38_005194 [Zalerion maritima]
MPKYNTMPVTTGKSNSLTLTRETSPMPAAKMGPRASDYNPRGVHVVNFVWNSSSENATTTTCETPAMFALKPQLFTAWVGLASATLQVVPGGTWTATNTGEHVQAHGAGIIEVGGTYYMIGEDKTDGSAFQNINCYSSTNLVEWAYEGALLSKTNSITELGDNRVVERPKVLYNDNTGNYVLWMHIDSSDYGEAKVGVAVGDTVCGSYEPLHPVRVIPRLFALLTVFAALDWVGAYQPLGYQSRDIGVFEDDDGSAYLFTEDRPNGLRIAAMTDDYLNVTEEVYLWDENIESPAILKQNGYYFVMGSHLTGWDANDNVYSYATSLSGPWSDWATFADVGSDTYTSQSSFIVPLGPESAIYMGDRWISTNLMRSTYIWLPLAISGTTLTMADRVNWIPNMAESTWSVAPSETWAEAEDQALENGAVTLDCSGCSGDTAVGYVGGPSNGRITFSGVHSDVDATSTIRIKFVNGDSDQRFAQVTCNGVVHDVAFLPTGSGSTVSSSVANCALSAGDSNTIIIDTDGSGNWGPDVDRIMEPDCYNSRWEQGYLLADKLAVYSLWVGVRREFGPTMSSGEENGLFVADIMAENGLFYFSPISPPPAYPTPPSSRQINMRWISSFVAFAGIASGSVLFPRNETSGNVATVDPRDACPGYKVTDVTTSPVGLTASLELAGEACDVYGDDIHNLTLKVTYESENRLRVVIEDAEEMAYQIPESVLPQSPTEDCVSNSALEFKFEHEPFSFTVSRAETDEVIFDSSAAGLIFESMYLRLRTHLPKNPNLYGLPEHSDSLRFETEDYIRTLWNRDAYGTGDKQNLYSSHPIYFEHRLSGTHGVFQRSTVGMDVMINQTADGEQYLEYNILGGVFDLTFYAGPGPADVSRQYAETIGLPVMFPYWAFGFNQCRYGYRDAFAVAEMISNYSNAGIPLETAWIDIDYMDYRKVFTNDPDRFPTEMLREIVDHLHANNQQFTVMVDPAIAYQNNSAYDHGKDLDVFLKNPDGSYFKGVVWPGVTVFPDWFHPEIQSFWDSEMLAFFDPETGVDIDQCWIDMSDPSSFGCEFGCDAFEVVAESDSFPPDPPPVRNPPRPLPGWSCAFQPNGTNCKTKGELYSTAEVLVGVAAPRGEGYGGSDTDSSDSGKHLGLPGRDLLYPEYSIHNAWAYQPDWNDEEGGLSNYTVPTNVIHANGIAELDLHNTFGHMMTVVMRKSLLKRRPTRRPSIIGRSTFSSTGSHGGKWTGDNFSSWWHYVLNIRSILNFAITQNPFVGADVCGFGGNTTEQLCARWAMLGAFQPFYRNHNGDTSISQEFYLWDSVTEAAKKAIDIRYRLMDYMYTSLWKQTEDGTPTLNPMWFLYPQDNETFALETQFFYGEALLVAPVMEENATHAEVYFPEDVFYDWYTGEKRVGEGKKVNITDQGLTDIPLFVKGGNILPLRVRSAMTTTDLRRENFELLVAVGMDGTAEGMLYMDDGDSLVQETTTEVRFKYENGTLSSEGSYDYQAGLKITKVTFLGVGVVKGSSVDGNGITHNPGRNEEETTIELDVELSRDFVLELDF